MPLPPPRPQLPPLSFSSSSPETTATTFIYAKESDMAVTAALGSSLSALDIPIETGSVATVLGPAAPEAPRPPRPNEAAPDVPKLATPEELPKAARPLEGPILDLSFGPPPEPKPEPRPEPRPEPEPKPGGLWVRGSADVPGATTGPPRPLAPLGPPPGSLGPPIPGPPSSGAPAIRTPNGKNAWTASEPAVITVPPGSALGRARRPLFVIATASVAALALVGGVVAFAAHAKHKAAAAQASPASPASAAASAVAPPAPSAQEATIEFTIRASPPEAKIFVDGMAMPANPASGKRPRDGALHTVRIEAPGFDTREETVAFERSVLINIELRPAPAEGPAPTVAAATSPPRAGPRRPPPAPAPRPARPHPPPAKPIVDPENPYQ
jgi:hypothetical protein